MTTPSYETLLICLGAQKAGTTWLWQYLLEHPQCAVTPLKEVHFFDSGPKWLIRQLENTERALADARSPDERAFLQQKRDFIETAIGFSDRENRTAEAFEALVASVAETGTKVIAEFTPANGLLSAETLTDLCNLPIAPKFVLILRDPVDRLWSQIRMHAKQQEKDPDRRRALAMDIVDRFVAGQDDAVPRRYDYATVLKRAQRIIPPDRLFVDFFETFIDQTRIDLFCDFLGVDRLPAKLDERKLAGIDLSLAPEARVRLRDRLAPQYAAVERQLGALPERWRDTLAL